MVKTRREVRSRRNGKGHRGCSFFSYILHALHRRSRHFERVEPCPLRTSRPKSLSSHNTTLDACSKASESLVQFVCTAKQQPNTARRALRNPLRPSASEPTPEPLDFAVSRSRCLQCGCVDSPLSSWLPPSRSRHSSRRSSMPSESRWSRSFEARFRATGALLMRLLRCDD